MNCRRSQSDRAGDQRTASRFGHQRGDGQVPRISRTGGPRPSRPSRAAGLDFLLQEMNREVNTIGIEGRRTACRPS